MDDIDSAPYREATLREVEQRIAEIEDSMVALERLIGEQERREGSTARAEQVMQAARHIHGILLERREQLFGAVPAEGPP